MKKIVLFSIFLLSVLVGNSQELLIHKTDGSIISVTLSNIDSITFAATPIINLATVSTGVVTDITQTTATCGGDVTADGGATVTARGICWSTTQTPTIVNSHTTDGTGIGVFTSAITGLTDTTTYYVRAYATNSVGTAYGNQVSFITIGGALTVTDFDGNVYTTVVIGTQTWMVENLKVTHYRNGEPIPNVTDNTAWSALTTGAYCWYNNDITNKTPYGALYNWFTVNDSRNIAPAGWHVPSDAELTILTTYLGGESVAGGKMKETGTTHWHSPNAGATNESGFTALPSGYRYDLYGSFSDLGYVGYWWSSTASGVNAWIRYVYYSIGYCYRYNNFNKMCGLPVRLLKD